MSPGGGGRPPPPEHRVRGRLGAVDRTTVAIYERESARYEAGRRPRFLPQAEALGARRPPGTAIDLGCGPGWYTAALGEPVVALDAARSMVRRTREVAPTSLGVQADLGALPFRRASLAAGWARNTYVHLRQDQIPMALQRPPPRPRARRADRGDGVRRGRWRATRCSRTTTSPAGGSRCGPRSACATCCTAPASSLDELVSDVRGEGDPTFTIRARRAPTLPDFVAAGMRVLVSGLNPSVHAADAGIGYVTPGNRFWPAALEAGLASRDRDARHALLHHGMGMTDLVKRATPRAAELTREEYRAGLARLDRLCAWLQPAAICFVGLAGWRAAVDRHAQPGWQPRSVGGRPAYVLPSTSGLNAATPLAVLVDHLRAVLAGPPAPAR